ncbi:hypothetical protein EVAR_67752_1 [Eumeta japonica]|uniref:Uncharacterized protein n=1 Tax=Eumeta variegata TaxID=151549 RepID=A0A4C1ZJB5_EUMVA|nr:hypothetical protein EVAR_67752_1 [Eumeta japonica]
MTSTRELISALDCIVAEDPLPAISQVCGSSSGREIDASQAERLGPLSITRSAFSLARSAQGECDNESCFCVRAAGVHRVIRRYHVKKTSIIRDFKG